MSKDNQTEKGLATEEVVADIYDRFNRLMEGVPAGNEALEGHLSGDPSFTSDDGNWEDPGAILKSVKNNLWAIHGTMVRPCSAATPKLFPGTYVPCVDQEGQPYLVRKQHSATDELYELPDTNSEQILREIRKFWKSKAKYERAKQVWKRGILMYGPPGCGKTGIVQLLIAEVVRRGGIVILSGNPIVTSINLEMIRSIEPDRPILVVHEEVETIIRRYCEQDLLTLLDGERQVNNVVHIATTNYVEELPPRIRARPSRFDLVIEVPPLGEAARRVYISKFMSPFSDVKFDMEEVVKNSDGMSLSDIKEVLLSTYILELGSLEDRIKYVRGLQFQGAQSTKEK